MFVFKAMYIHYDKIIIALDFYVLQIQIEVFVLNKHQDGIMFYGKGFGEIA